MKAQNTHTGEERWSNLDNSFIECISSGCAIVGFFVGYGSAVGKKHSQMCQSRNQDAEMSVGYAWMPPLCKQDDVGARNKKVEEKRCTKEMRRADASHIVEDTSHIVEDDPGESDAAGSGDNPFGVDYDPDGPIV